MDWPALAGAVILAAAAIAVYSGTFSVPLLYDDDLTIANNPSIRHLSTAFWPPAATTAGGRPVLNLSLAVNYAVSGTEVWSYHALNLTIHVLAGLALFGIVRRTLLAREADDSTLIAFFTALLWTLHPLQTESVTYIVQRAESLMGLFYLLTLYCFIRSAEADGPRKRMWSALCVGACLLGMGTKEVMVSAPVVALLYDRMFLTGSLREAWRRRRGLYVGMALTWLVLCLLVLSTHGRAGSAGFGRGVPWWRYALIQFPAILHYLRLCIWPHPLIFDYGNAVASPSLVILACALAVCGLVAATAWALARSLAAGFLGACFFAVLAPSSSVVPVVTETMAEHRVYLALAAVVALIVLALHRLLGRRSLLLFLPMAAALGLLTVRRNDVYRSAMSLWADTVAARPGNDRAHNYLGLELEKTPGRLDDAIAQYEESLRLNPTRAQAHNYLGKVLENVPGRLDDAIAQFEEALRLNPDLAEAHNNYGNALNTEGRIADAVVQYREALRLNPEFAEAHNNLGNALSMEGMTLEAVPQYEEALRLKPDMVGFHLNFAVTLLRIPGRTDEAVKHLKQVLRLQPNNVPARQILSRINGFSQ